MSEEGKGRILVADDSRFFLQSLERLLEAESYRVFTAEDGHQAIDAARTHRPDLILLDVEMPRLDGIAACRKIKDDPATAHIPILFVTSQANSDLRLRGLRAGGEEFLTKPFVPEEILAQVDKFMARIKSASSMMDRMKILEVERNEFQQRLSAGTAEKPLALAFRVTPSNPLGIVSDIDEHLLDFIRTNRRFVVLYIAVDNMDRVDVLFGSETVFETQMFLFNKVVEYLREISADLNTIRVCRNLADDFIIFLPDGFLTRHKLDTSNIDEFGTDLLRRLRFSMESQFLKKEVATILNLTTGSTWVPTSSRLSFHRQILNAIKDASEGAYNFMSRDRRKLQNRLKEMILSRAVRIVTMPIVRTTDYRIAAYEALCRGDYPELERPQLMFDVAEESKQVHALSRLCREKSIELLPQIEEGKTLFVNFHPDDFYDEQVAGGTPDEPIFKADPRRVVIEITERSAIKDPDKFTETLNALKKRGFKIAIDDLGSGYTSLGLIASLEPDYIKFDMSLVRGIERSPTKQSLLKTLAKFTQDIGATSVAEGVETRDELDVVREFKCDLVQGYYFAKPDSRLATESDFAFAKNSA